MKKSRHSKIIELIENYDIETQEELAEELKNHCSVNNEVRDPVGRNMLLVKY